MKNEKQNEIITLSLWCFFFLIHDYQYPYIILVLIIDSTALNNELNCSSSLETPFRATINHCKARQRTEIKIENTYPTL